MSRQTIWTRKHWPRWRALSFAGCAVVISHDRWFLDRLATHILAFEGNGHVEWFEGNLKITRKISSAACKSGQA